MFQLSNNTIILNIEKKKKPDYSPKVNLVKYKHLCIFNIYYIYLDGYIVVKLSGGNFKLYDKMI